MDRPGKAEMSKDYREYAKKEITPTMEAFAEWLTKETGYKVDARTVALAGSLRNDFQASDSWKADPRNPVLSREAKAAERAAEQLAKAEETARKAQERIAKLEAAVTAAKAKAKVATPASKTAKASASKANDKAEAKAA